MQRSASYFIGADFTGLFGPFTAVSITSQWQAFNRWPSNGRRPV